MIGAVLLQQTHKNTSISTFVQSGYKKDRQCRSCNQMKKYTAYCCARFSTCWAFSSFLELLSIQNQPISALPLTISSLNS